MKHIIAKLVATALSFTTLPAIAYDVGTMTDNRDGHKYFTVTIDDQVWMKENLAYKTEGSFAPNGNDENISTYGLLYTYQAAQNICPSGWQLPTKTDFEILLSKCDNKNCNMDKLIELGFGSLPAGYRWISGDYEFGKNADFWTSTPKDKDYIYHATVYNDKADVSAISPELAISVRCIKSTDETFTDYRDGHKYRTVKIDNQVWMAENMAYKTAGSYAPNGKDDNIASYGYLYDWQAAKNVCPTGWRLPSKADFETLLSKCGNKDCNIKKLDNLGLTVYPVGVRWGNSGYNGFGSYADFWSSTPQGNTHAHYFDMTSTNALIRKYYHDGAFSVRCIKD